MHKFVSFLLALLLTLSVLSTAQARPAVKKAHPHKIVLGVNYFYTRVTDHNPPMMLVEYFTSYKTTHSTVPGKVKITVRFAKPPKGYKDGQASIEFYEYTAGIPAIPAQPPSPEHPGGTPLIPAVPSAANHTHAEDYFDLSPASGHPENMSLKKNAVTITYKDPEKGDLITCKGAIFKLAVKPGPIKKKHLMVEVSYNYASKTNPINVQTKGPIFTTVLLEKP